MTRLGRTLVGLAALMIGATAVYLAPTIEDVSKPIDFRGSVGDRIVGRAFASTVTRVRFADALRLADGTRVETEGTWMIVDLRVTTRLNTVGLGGSSVRVGDVVYGAYVDPADRDFSAGGGEPGITEEGTLAFELPASVRRQTHAELVLSRGALNPDQQNVVGIDPSRLDEVDEATIVPQTQVDLEFPWGR